MSETNRHPMRYHGACNGCGCDGCGNTGKVPAMDAPKPKPKRERKARGCARCGSSALYAGGLCRPCAVSFGVWTR